MQLFLRDCVVELNPLDLPSQGLYIIKDSKVDFALGAESTIDLSVKRSALLLVDEVSNLETVGIPAVSGVTEFFLSQGYVSIGSISTLKSVIKIPSNRKPRVDITIDSVTLNTCADSTQVLIQTLNALKPPVEANDGIRFRTELPNLVDIFSEVDETTFMDGYTSSTALSKMGDDVINDDIPSNLEFVESYYVDQSTRLKWNSGSSSGSLNNGVSRADMLLEQDLSVLAGKSKNSSNSNSIEGSISSVSEASPYASSTSSSSSRNGSQSYARLDNFEQRAYTHDSVLNIEEDHFAKDLPSIYEQPTESGSTSPVSTPRRRRSVTATIPTTEKQEPLITIKARILSVDWLLFDGYDWSFTRDTINKAVNRVEYAADQFHREANGRGVSASDRFTPSPRNSGEVGNNEERGRIRNESPEGEVQTVVGDLLFNSIYIGVPAGDDPDMLRGAINRELNDDMSEAGSNASTNITSRSSSANRRSVDLGYRRKKKLALKRSKRYKMKISLRDVCADVIVLGGVNDQVDLSHYSPDTSGIVLNTIDIRVKDLEIFDNVHTSTWNKFLSYMRDAGERESHASMVHILLDTVKPVDYLAVSEIQLKVSVLPLRLIVDQDALDFLTRFFEFKDERFVVAETNEEIFIQKLDVRSVSVKLDYKPKKVDYMGLKSGRTIEFMNFFTLDGADIVLRHVVLYGIDGFGKVSDLLNGIWMPDIKQNQLGKFLSGLSSVHSLVRLGSGVRDLFVIPLQEYKKDGRVVRGLQKGAWFFAKNTTNELAKLGAKLAAGTQGVLESAEQALGGSGASARSLGAAYRSPYSDDIVSDDEEPSSPSTDQQHIVSLYANQPGGVSEGLRSAYKSMGKNLTMARDAVADIGVDAAERGNAQGAAIAVMRAAPVVLIRPMIGATEAVSKTLMGVTNQIEPDQLQDVQDVSIISGLLNESQNSQILTFRNTNDSIQIRL
ncbi:Atg2p [Sugiyamaella lignohabitans]|uniref:Autophagy-related protein 2 n=1 Tax=Sugiyamaella lignohabitans TaxID=796027 RepID=A0A167F0V3_9ASCO|nr:Atg2p [Sugiyamaella lignohabitans]ANB14684.1 Atg2p [Sugiyamaella lignohabitans]